MRNAATAQHLTDRVGFGRDGVGGRGVLTGSLHRKQILPISTILVLHDCCGVVIGVETPVAWWSMAVVVGGLLQI